MQVSDNTNSPMADFPLTPSEEKRARYVVLDSWRGVAAAMLAIFHLQVLSHLYFIPIMRHAYLFVDFFFLLSGFVISHAYWARIQNGKSFSIFMMRRLGRLYPLHLVMLLIFVFAELCIFLMSPYLGHMLPRPPFSADRTVATIPLNMLLLNGVGLTPGATWNGPSWSISAECFVYLIFGIVVFIQDKFRTPIILTLIFVSAIVLYYWSPGFEVCNRFALARCTYSFFIGHFVWRARRYNYALSPVIIEALALAIVISFVWTAEGVTQLLAPAPFGFAVFVFSKEKGLFSRLMSGRLMQFLGRASFSIYMVHYFIAFVVFNLIKLAGKALHYSTSATPSMIVSLGKSHPHLFAPALIDSGADLAVIVNPWIMDAVSLVFVILVCLVGKFSYEYLEKPSVRLINSAIDQRFRY